MEENLGSDQTPRKRVRRTYSKQFKQTLVDEVSEDQQSIAKIALEHQINANLLHKWVVTERDTDASPSFVPVAVNSDREDSNVDAISFELRTDWGTLRFSHQWDPASVAMLIKSLA